MGADTGTAPQVPVADGRELDVVLLGPEHGVPVFVRHGTPGTAGMFSALVDVGTKRVLRHITCSRPGYGGSTRQPGRAVADCVIDVAAIADALGYERFYSVGGSGAGPHSIACAALLAKHTGARPELRPNAGHLSMAISSYGDILDGLLGLPSLWR